MELRKILSKRLLQMMDESIHLDTQQKVSEKAGLSQSTIHRILTCESGATIDAIESLSKAFGVKPAAFLAVDEASANLVEQWAKLSDDERQRVLGYIEISLNKASKKQTQ